eukprot:GEMP01021161.1.p1 GENE.GEMP01021161.1~~GEMP01021161.1.p1  ORF type:complete len:666 (+),score=227.33 GEMP01021161.1:132-2129(+)
MRFVGFAIAASLTLREQGGKQRPIAKVIKLLEDMKAQLTKEQKDDEAVYEKLACWCTTNDKEKSQSISDATAHISQLESAIKEYSGSIAELESKIERAKGEYNKDWESLKTATEVRMEDRAKFSAEEKDMLATIDGCKQAIVALSKHHPELAQVKAAARKLLDVRGRVMATLNLDAKAILSNFLSHAKEATAFLAIPGFKSYAPQSGQIFGILKQMREDFESNLSDAQREEHQARAAFAELKAAKESQMAATRKQQANFEADLADNMEKKAAAEQDLEDTEEQLSNDQKFLANLRARCSKSDEEYNARVKSRQEEIEAVQDTIVILDSDESLNTFNKSLGFAQVKDTSRAASVAKVVSLMRKFSRKDPRLGLIAMSAQLDAFTKVKTAIDGMITQLKAEKEDEINHRDFCIEQFNQNERDQNAKADERDDLQVKMDSLASEIETLTKELTTLNKENDEMKVQMQRAGDNRASENADFQEAVVDQRITQQILAKARARMAQKYALLAEEPQVGAAHTQTSGTKTEPGSGPARFNEYKHSGGGARVLSMLDKVIADSKQVENEAIQDEKDQQTAYEGFIQDSNKSIVSNQKSIVNKTEKHALASEAKTIATSDHTQALADLDRLNNYKAQLHGSCDFVLKNFDARQEARDQEVAALRQAKDILGGMQ